MERAAQPSRVATRFEARWLAEAVRLRELAAHQPVGDDEAVAAARAAGGDLEARILHRATWLAERDGLAARQRVWSMRSSVFAWALLLVAFVLGCGTALAVLGDGSRAVNVVWALLGLLGVNLLSLVLWCVGMGMSSSGAGGTFGHLWMWLNLRLARHGDDGALVRALAELYRVNGLTRWRLGATSHAVWSAALLGALLAMLASLSLRSYGFVWETTILSSDVFVGLVTTLGAVPALFGFAVPDADMVRASGLVALSDDASRRAWSQWLVGALVVYGVMPRLMLWALCQARLSAGRSRVQLDTGLPGHALLVGRLMPESERIGVTDAAPTRLHRAQRSAMPSGIAGEAVALGLELRADLEWPPLLPPGAHDGGVVDSREQRRKVIDALAANPPTRLLLTCDPRLSPDRGSLELIAALASRAHRCVVWLALPRGRGVDAERRAHWLEALAGLGFHAADVIEDEVQAMNWLGGEA